MFCGSCMHDNTLAKSLQEIGTEVTLIPTYTPIRVDEPDQSINRVFLGGINVYLDSQFSWWNRLPGFLRKPLDAPWVINLATRFGVSNDAKRLGELTLAMLAGINGPQKNEIAELVDFIAGDLKPDAVLFSNALLSGVAPHLRKSFDGRICCLLQGDDIFLQDLTEPYQSKAKIAMRENAFAFDSLLSHSKFYRDFMSAELGIESERFEVVPLGIELEGHNGKPVDRNNDRFTIGYLARICPEKGLLSLVDAFETLHIDHPQTNLRVAGYCGPRDKDYLESVRQRAEPLGDAFEYIGSPDTRGEKVRFLQSLDVLSVPSPYREPKGLYVLEALANGVPVVQPDHGAFPELIATTGGGLLFEPKNSNSLTHRLRELLQDADQRVELARNGHAAVREHLSGPKMAEITRNALLGRTAAIPASVEAHSP